MEMEKNLIYQDVLVNEDVNVDNDVKADKARLGDVTVPATRQSERLGSLGNLYSLGNLSSLGDLTVWATWAV